MRRTSSLDLKGCLKIFQSIRHNLDQYWPGLEDELEAEITFLENNKPQDLVEGIIHGDMFPDNVLFEGDQITGVIDFYFSCNDILALDLAVCANSWCFDKQGQMEFDKLHAILESYDQSRSLKKRENENMVYFFRKAALRFLLTRAFDRINVQEGTHGIPKDPLKYLRILHFHQERERLENYG